MSFLGSLELRIANIVLSPLEQRFSRRQLLSPRQPEDGNPDPDLEAGACCGCCDGVRASGGCGPCWWGFIGLAGRRTCAYFSGSEWYQQFFYQMLLKPLIAFPLGWGVVLALEIVGLLLNALA